MYHLCNMYVYDPFAVVTHEWAHESWWSLIIDRDDYLMTMYA